MMSSPHYSQTIKTFIIESPLTYLPPGGQCSLKNFIKVAFRC